MARWPIRSARPPAAGACSGSPPSKSAHAIWRGGESPRQDHWAAATTESPRGGRSRQDWPMRTRLRNVEIAFGKVDQRLLTLERVIIPPAEPPDIAAKRRARSTLHTNGHAPPAAAGGRGRQLPATQARRRERTRREGSTRRKTARRGPEEPRDPSALPVNPLSVRPAATPSRRATWTPAERCFRRASSSTWRLRARSPAASISPAGLSRAVGG